jgi:hypothetical protein
LNAQRQPGVIPTPNRLKREFPTAAANRKWASDFAHIDTAEDWLFLVVVLDLFSCQVVGWAMAKRMDTALVEAALIIPCKDVPLRKFSRIILIKAANTPVQPTKIVCWMRVSR